MAAETDHRTGLMLLGAALVAVGLTAIVLGPSAAIVLATGLTIIATVISVQSPVNPARTKSVPLHSPQDIEHISEAFSGEAQARSMPAMSVATVAPVASVEPVDMVSATQLAATHGDAAIMALPAPNEGDQELVALLEASDASDQAMFEPDQRSGKSWLATIAGSAKAKAWAGSVSWTDSLTMLIWGAIAGALGWMLFTGLTTNPVGFFGDEAEIGFRTNELLTKRIIYFDIPIFYNHFGYTHLGALPLYASAPIVAILGLTEFSVRFASVIFAAGGLILLVALVRRLKWAYGEVGILAFAFSPIFIHLSRVNFGHSPSFFCTAAGLYCLVRAKQEKSIRWPILTGVGFGLSIYGNAAYYLATPVVIAGLVAGEVVVNRLEWKRYLPLAKSLAVATLFAIPVVYRALTDTEFMRRFNDKQYSEDPLLSWNRLNTVADNYGKYFSSDFLFVKGESGMPGGFISRHSVPGAGELPWIVLPLVIAGIIAIVRCKEPAGRAMGVASLVILVLYPLPDVLSTSTLNPPYTLAVFPTLIFVPLLAAFGINWIVSELRARAVPLKVVQVVPMALLAIVVVGGVQFYRGPFENYPNVSAEYYGWQYGPEQAIGRFSDYDPIYDRYFLDGDFNEAFIFLDFYLIDDPDLRARAAIGGFEVANLARHDLFAVRRERYERLLEGSDVIRNYAKVVDVIYYPNGQIAMYLVDVNAANYDGTPEQPR